jgi:ribosomal protein S27E
MSLIRQNLNDERFLTIEAKFNSKCHECEEDLYEGDNIIFDTKYKKAYCLKCGKEMM